MSDKDDALILAKENLYNIRQALKKLERDLTKSDVDAKISCMSTALIELYIRSRLPKDMLMVTDSVLH